MFKLTDSSFIVSCFYKEVKRILFWHSKTILFISYLWIKWIEICLEQDYWTLRFWFRGQADGVVKKKTFTDYFQELMNPSSFPKSNWNMFSTLSFTNLWHCSMSVDVRPYNVCVIQTDSSNTRTSFTFQYEGI